MGTTKIIAIFTDRGFETLTISADGSSRALAYEVCKEVESHLGQVGELIKKSFLEKKKTISESNLMGGH